MRKQTVATGQNGGHQRWLSATCLVAMACVHACVTRDATLAPSTTTASSSTGGVGGSAAHGGGGFAGSAGAGGAAGGAAGAGGMSVAGAGGSGGHAPCDPLDPSACPGAKCTVVNEATGQLGCATAGPLGAWQRCMSDSDCATGLWCDHVTEVCKPVCQGVADCGDATTVCASAASELGDSIPGLRLCVANCNPLDSACGEQTTCVYLASPPLFDCFASLGLGDGDSCAAASDCASGLTCTPTSECRLWCDTPGSVFDMCKQATWCCALDPAPTYGGDELGYCGCP